MKQLICPISNERTNETSTRISALLSAFAVAASLATQSPWIVLLLSADFFIRAFMPQLISPVSILSTKITESLHLPGKLIDKAPKIFAARLGFLFSLSVGLLLLLKLSIASIIIGAMLILFASLEFSCAFCVGCIIYSYLIVPFFK